jgi:hypothetical protein
MSTEYRIREYKGFFTVEKKVEVTTGMWWWKKTKSEWWEIDKSGWVIHPNYKITGFIQRHNDHFSIPIRFKTLQDAVTFIKGINEQPKYHYL